MSDQSNRADKSTETESPPPEGIFFGTASLRDILDGVVFDIDELEGLEGIDVLESVSDAEISRRVIVGDDVPLEKKNMSVGSRMKGSCFFSPSKSCYFLLK